MLDGFYHLIGRDADPILWWQMALRAVIIFFWAILLYRLLPRRAFGRNAVVDIILVVIVGSTLSRALTGNAPLLPVITATAVLASLYAILIFAASRIEGLGSVVKGRSIRLVKDGRIDEEAMRNARIGERDLRESLRLRGVTNIEEVATAHLERNGSISVVRRG